MEHTKVTNSEYTIDECNAGFTSKSIFQKYFGDESTIIICTNCTHSSFSNGIFTCNKFNKEEY